MLTGTDLEQWFPDEPILTVPASALPDGLSHQPTRQILSDVGMPQALLEVVEIDIDSPRGIRTLATSLEAFLRVLGLVSGRVG